MVVVKSFFRACGSSATMPPPESSMYGAVRTSTSFARSNLSASLSCWVTNEEYRWCSYWPLLTNFPRA